MSAARSFLTLVGIGFAAPLLPAIVLVPLGGAAINAMLYPFFTLAASADATAPLLPAPVAWALTLSSWGLIGAVFALVTRHWARERMRWAAAGCAFGVWMICLTTFGMLGLPTVRHVLRL